MIIMSNNMQFLL